MYMYIQNIRIFKHRRVVTHVSIGPVNRVSMMEISGEPDIQMSPSSVPFARYDMLILNEGLMSVHTRTYKIYAFTRTYKAWRRHYLTIHLSIPPSIYPSIYRIAQGCIWQTWRRQEWQSGRGGGGYMPWHSQCESHTHRKRERKIRL
jgi:hypothetical protein